MVWHVVLPYTKAGVVGGIMLGLGRALGETMAVTFVIGNSYDLSLSLFSPGNSIASSLANEFAEAHSDMHTSALIELGLLLFVITLIVLAVAKLLLLRVARREGDAHMSADRDDHDDLYGRRILVNRDRPGAVDGRRC